MWARDWITLIYMLLTKGWAGWRLSWPRTRTPHLHREALVGSRLASHLLLLSWLLFLPLLLGAVWSRPDLRPLWRTWIPCAGLSTAPTVANLPAFEAQIGTQPIAGIIGEAGTVRLRVLVDTHGSCQQAHLLEASHPLMAAAVEAGLPALRFQPGRQSGRKTAMWQEVEVRFEPGR